MATKYHGKGGLLYMSTDNTPGNMVLVGGLSEFTVGDEPDRVDTTEFGANNKTSVQGFPSYRGTFRGFWASDVTVIAAARRSTVGSYLGLYPSRNAMSKFLGGPAWVSASLSQSVNGAVEINGSFEANGDWQDAL